jgi:hypothetical protein
MSTLTERLRIAPGAKALVLLAPRTMMKALSADLPEGAKISTRGGGPFSVILGFAARQREVEGLFRKAHPVLAPDGILGLAYPKKSSAVKTDLTRSDGWDGLADRGWVPVAQVSVDDTWSALRFVHDPGLKTDRDQRRARRAKESPTMKIKPSDEQKQTVRLRRDEVARPRRKRRRSSPTVDIRGPQKPSGGA